MAVNSKKIPKNEKVKNWYYQFLAFLIEFSFDFTFSWISRSIKWFSTWISFWSLCCGYFWRHFSPKTQFFIKISLKNFNISSSFLQKLFLNKPNYQENYSQLAVTLACFTFEYLLSFGTISAVACQSWPILDEIFPILDWMSFLKN